MIPRSMNARHLARLVGVAKGRTPADVVVVNGRVVNVYSQEVLHADVAIAGGRIARVGPAAHCIGSQTSVIDAEDAYVLPTYFEPHAHPWSLFTPDAMAQFVLPLGNSTFVADLLSLQLHLPPDEMRKAYQRLQHAPVRWFWAVRIAGQSAQNPSTLFPRDELESLFDADDVLQTAEVTQWARILAGDEELLERIASARSRGLRIDAHSAGAGPSKIGDLAAAGFTADHEAINLEEARAALRQGFHVMLRNSSLRPDLDRLVSLATESNAWSRMSVTSDGSGPTWLSEHGLSDGIVRDLVKHGVEIPRAVAMASLNPATYFRLDHDLGGLAPGRVGDLQVLVDFDGRPPEVVMVDGAVVAERGTLSIEWPELRWRDIPFRTPRVPREILWNPSTYSSSEAPGQVVPVMRFVSPVITRAESASTDDSGWVPDALRAVHFTRDGSRKSAGWAQGLAPHLDGLATSYTTSGGLIVIGRDPQAMALAARTAFDETGGIAVVDGGRVSALLELDIAYMMSSLPVEEIVRAWEAVDKAVRHAGYSHQELLFSLLFLTADFLPDLRLVSDGLLEVKSGRLLNHAERIHP